MLLGVDWLYLHRNKVDCYDKAIEYLDGNGAQRVLQCKKKATLVRIVAYMEANISRRKGYVLFKIHISGDKCKEVEDADSSVGTQFYKSFMMYFP